ncbi:8-oxo-(d)GTP phosphatase [Psilocybe cubensis]|uniref:8-oxo-(D)GTP phosphatase n=2 Tax=Psilocybe cubensis TaxID=181762 RepID=A0ACB8GLN3_PSICU|nr:8-oxo-(d)GTP phosphatase [Psilocybe cubensis]KAH9476499.1 8-oxo-(d)GTP phosphatase [Psilocybe cubensis]
MAESTYPTTQYLAGDFVLSAGSVLFRRRPRLGTSTSTSTSTSNPTNTLEPELEICILHYLTHDEWLLPKGRKDRGEPIERTAVRETYEETGYVCALWPQRMPTLATVPVPAPGQGAGQQSHGLEVPMEDGYGLIEPIAVTVREIARGRVKIIYWYITVVEEGVEKVEGSQMENENFESMFVDVREAEERLTFRGDRDVVRVAIDIVCGRGVVQGADTHSGTLSAV